MKVDEHVPVLVAFHSLTLVAAKGIYEERREGAEKRGQPDAWCWLIVYCESGACSEGGLGSS